MTFEVTFPTCHDTLPEIPDAVLPAVYQILRRHLGLAAGLLQDIGAEPRFWRTSTFYPGEGSGEYHNEQSGFLSQVRDLFNRMAETQSKLLRADIALWPRGELFFFNKLRLWAWTFGELFSDNEVADGLLSLSDKAFWKENERRERLHLLRLRWRDLPLDKRELLERRLVDGRARYSQEEPEAGYNRGRSIESAVILGWLRNRGCELSNDTQRVLPILRSADPRWRPEWDEAADESLGVRGGRFQIDSDPSPLLNAPLNQIIRLAREHTRSPIDELVAYRPFDGLVEQRPGRAVAALTNAARQADYPEEFWRSAMQNWPVGARLRLVWLFGARLARLPLEIVFKCRHEVFSWLEKCLLALAAQDRLRALSILDVLLNKLFEGEGEETENEIGNTRLAEIFQGQSRQSFDQAWGSPVGRAVELLLNLLNSQNPGRGSGLPPDIQSRLECLIAAPGENSNHVVCVVAQELTWLDFVDPEWMHSTVVPWFSLEHPASEYAWGGFLHANRLPASELFSLLKPHFLQMFIPTLNRVRDDSMLQRLHEFLVLGCFWHQDAPAYISFDETRRALQQTDDEGRAYSIDSLNRNILNGDQERWQGFGKPFLERAWPQEMRCQTERTSRAFLRLVKEAGDLFPEVVQTVLPYLVPIPQDSTFVYGLTRQNGEEGIEPSRRFPDATLALLDKLVSDNPDQIPYELDAAVEMIAEAKPSLRQDSRWRRLNGITPRR